MIIENTKIRKEHLNQDLNFLIESADNDTARQKYKEMMERLEQMKKLEEKRYGEELDNYLNEYNMELEVICL